MDTVKAKSKPRCRLFDCAINSVKNQPSSKIKMNKVKSLDPACFSSKKKSPASNVNTKNSVAFENELSSEVQYSTESFVAFKNKSSSEVQYSTESFVAFENKSSSEVQYSTERFEVRCPNVKESSLSPKEASQEKLCDSPSNNTSIDYNLPISSSDFLTVNPEFLNLPKLIEESKTDFSSNNNSFEGDFYMCNMRQDSPFYERSAECRLPISVSTCDSFSSQKEAERTSSKFLTNDSFNESSSDTSGVKVSSNVITITVKVSDSEASTGHRIPISVQVTESGENSKESSIKLCASILEEKHRQGTGTDYHLPVMILISESGSSLSKEEKPQYSGNVENSVSKCNINTLSKNSLVDSGFHTSAPFVEQKEAGFFMTKGISGDNNSTWDIIPLCPDTSLNFPPNELSGAEIKNRSYGHTDQFLSRSDASIQENSVYYSTPIRNFMSEDGSGDVGRNSYYYTDKCTAGRYKPTSVCLPGNNVLKSYNRSDLENVSRGMNYQQFNCRKLNEPNFSPNNLCQNCFKEYSHQLDLMIAKFKGRIIDKTQCSCINSSGNKSYTECFEESSVSYSLPVFPSSETAGFKALEISPNFPTNPFSDWNLSELPEDFSLPISNLCCDMNNFAFEEEENINPLSNFGVKSSFSPDNMEVDDSTDACNDCNENVLKKMDKRQRRNCLVPRYNSERLLSLKPELKFIDSHCHLDFLFQKIKYSGTFKAYKSLNKESFPTNYGGCVAVFCNPETFALKSSWEKHLDEENVWATFGCHPHFSRFYCEKYENVLLDALKHSQVRALGEIGLDYSRNNHCCKEVQIKVFCRQLKITVANRLPLVIHCREAHEDTLRLAREILPKDQKIHLHCFTDTWDEAEKWIEAFPNLCIGFTNRITLNTDENVFPVVKKMPMDRLLLETDAPYFVPKVYGRTKKWSNPGMAIHVAAQIAAIKQVDIEEVLHWARKNTNKVYGI